MVTRTAHVVYELRGNNTTVPFGGSSCTEYEQKWNLFGCRSSQSQSQSQSQSHGSGTQVPSTSTTRHYQLQQSQSSLVVGCWLLVVSRQSARFGNDALMVILISVRNGPALFERSRSRLPRTTLHRIHTLMADPHRTDTNTTTINF